MENEIEDTEDKQDKGRGTDSVMGHLSLGEVVIPRSFLDDPEVMDMLEEIFERGEADMAQYTVGDEANSINPETGNPEFGFFKTLKKIASFALPAAAAFIPGIGPLAAAGLGAAGGALGGGGLKGALLGGLTSGVGAGLSGGATGFLKGTALGGLENSISGALSPIGKAISSGISSLGSGVSGALSDFGNYTGLGDVYNSASGALSDFGNGLSSSIGNSYNGSDLQSAFKSGGDVLKSVGVGTGSESLGTAAAGVGSSAYGPSELPWLAGGGKTAIVGPSELPWLSGGTSGTAQLPWAAEGTKAADTNFLSKATGALDKGTPMAGNYASPIASALLGTFSNNKAEDALLKGQKANQALLAPYANGFSFTPGDLTQDPGYQFDLEQGTQAADRAQLARGDYFSGGAAKELSSFNQGLADKTYNSAFQRALAGNQAGLTGALANAGINTDIGNIKANSATNTGNLYSGALGSVLGGNSFTNTGALQGGLNNDFITQLLRKQQLGASAYAG